MKEFVKQMFSDPSGCPDEARAAAFLLVLSFIGDSIASVVMSPTHAFDAQQFGIGAGALAAGVGVWFGQRKGN